MSFVRPGVPPPLDAEFRPAALSVSAVFAEAGGAENTQPLWFALERDGGALSVYRTWLPRPEAVGSHAVLHCAERLAKSLLWIRGGYRLQVGGPAEIVGHVAQAFSPSGERALDAQVMSAVYERPFVVEAGAPGDPPEAREPSSPLGRHLDGCRIGLDLGGSDRKVAAVCDGHALYTEEITWEPKTQADPQYHQAHIQEALRSAAGRLPRVDAIGISAAGVYHGNRVRLASLFRGVPREVFDAQAVDLFARIGSEWGVPLAVANDGDVAALAGSMSLGDNAVLGLALGTSLAGGYVNGAGNITGWLNELASVPVDWRPEAPAEGWLGHVGSASQYLSQEAVFRLCATVGIALDASAPKAHRLRRVQELVAAGDERAVAVMETVGCYLGYALAYFARFYEARHVLLLGRVMSGPSGALILRRGREVLEDEFPELAARVALHLPDEEMRRLGQAVAAASLPAI